MAHLVNITGIVLTQCTCVHISTCVYIHTCMSLYMNTGCGLWRFGLWQPLTPTTMPVWKNQFLWWPQHQGLTVKCDQTQLLFVKLQGKAGLGAPNPKERRPDTIGVFVHTYVLTQLYKGTHDLVNTRHVTSIHVHIYSHCGDLNENGPQRLIDLNTWSPVSGTVWEGLRAMALLEICHWVWALRFSKAPHHSQLALSALCFVDQMWALSYCSSAMPPACYHVPYCDGHGF